MSKILGQLAKKIQSIIQGHWVYIVVECHFDKNQLLILMLLQRVNRFLMPNQDGKHMTDFLSGVTVALALIPEAVAFALVAGVNPTVGLYAGKQHTSRYNKIIMLSFFQKMKLDFL